MDKTRTSKFNGFQGENPKGVRLGQRAAIYARVSTSDQSCERQLTELAVFAARADYDVVGALLWEHFSLEFLEYKAD